MKKYQVWNSKTNASTIIEAKNRYHAIKHAIWEAEGGIYENNNIIDSYDDIHNTKNWHVSINFY